MAPSVAISVLNWNGADQTAASLRALRETDYPRFEITVSDNGSRPDDLDRLLREPVPGRLIRYPENLGFSVAHNRVMGDALERGLDYVWLVNNDCRVAPDTLSRLVALAESDPRIGIVSPIVDLPSPDGVRRTQFCGSWTDWSSLACVRAEDIATAREQELLRPGEMWVTGTAVLIRCATLRATGLFDERYFAYYEDNDLGVRASRAGHLSRMAFDASVTHDSHASTLTRPPHYFYLLARNAYLFWQTHTPPPFRRGLRRRLIGRTLREARWLADRGLGEHGWACLAGLSDALRGRFGFLRTRFARGRVAGLTAGLLPYRLAALLERAGESAA